ncbi:prolyl 4-hydroxylase subunit alpha-2 isoform X3 [Drosophila montana]|uniref:prolyl 4-hydroxylase subunit alpha-2 isoform X3 n=1 Tax=Drosophila montana TaxID=40370 RepID=UPI00313DC789
MMVGILCLLLLLIASAQSENISVGELKSVVKLERELLHNLRIYAQELETRLRLINGAIAEYGKNIQLLDRNPDLYMSNPLFAFRLMTHMRQHWPAWQLYMTQQPGSDQLKMQQRLLSLLPTRDAHKEAAQSLQSLFKFYNYAPASFLLKNKKHLRLSSLDCYHMGRELYEQQKYHEAVDWLAAAAAKYSPTSPHDELLGVSLGRIYEMQLKICEWRHSSCSHGLWSCSRRTSCCGASNTSWSSRSQCIHRQRLRSRPASCRSNAGATTNRIRIWSVS